jgi:photosystem II stability/assembly factor-like uncharacterized protein
MRISSDVFSALILGVALTSRLIAQETGSAVLVPISRQRITTLTPKAGYFNEPAIAINPVNPLHLVAPFQIRGNVAFSEDGGRSWSISSSNILADYKAAADVSAVFDNRGRAFVCHIAFDKLGTDSYWAHNETRNGIFVNRSTDGGKTWAEKPATVISQPTAPGIPFEDKPIIVADATYSKYAGNLYVGWTEFTLSQTRILFSRSTDGGESWSKPIKISSHDGSPRDDNGAVEGFTGSVGQDGTLYVAWADGENLVVSKSRNGGVSFSAPKVAAKIPASFYGVTGIDRANGFPTIAIDRHSDRLSLVWADYRNGDVDVFLTSSSDQGSHWSTPTRVNTDSLHDGADQFFPAFAIDQTDGSYNILFYDRRRDPGNEVITVVLARSTDQGRSFVNYQWGSDSFDPKGDFIGDYLGIAANGGKVFGIWAREAKADEAVVQDAGGKPSKLHLMVDVGSADFSLPVSFPGNGTQVPPTHFGHVLGTK